MYAYEGCVISVGDDGEWIGADGGYLFDRFRFHIAVPDEAGRILFSHSGLVSMRRRGVVFIKAPLSSTALESSGEVWTSGTMVWVWAC